MTVLILLSLSVCRIRYLEIRRISAKRHYLSEDVTKKSYGNSGLCIARPHDQLLALLTGGGRCSEWSLPFSKSLYPLCHGGQFSNQPYLRQAMVLYPGGVPCPAQLCLEENVCV